MTSGKKSKMLRKQVFGQHDPKVKHYKVDTEKALRDKKAVKGEDGKIRLVSMPTIFDGGLRGIYQKAKKVMKGGKR